MEDIKSERVRQGFLWGEENHTPEKWLLILGEEVGEVQTAVAEHIFQQAPLDNYRTELVQVAAVAVAMLECYDRNKDRLAIPFNFTELEKEIIYFLDKEPQAIRVREGAGPENLAASFALTVANWKRKMDSNRPKFYANEKDLRFCEGGKVK